MVKIGEYLDYAIALADKMVDYNPSIMLKENEMVFGTELSIILEMAKKINELENRLKVLEDAKEIEKI